MFMDIKSQSVFSELNKIKLETHNNKLSRKSIKLVNETPHILKPIFKEKVKGEIRKYFELNNNENISKWVGYN